MPSRKQIWRGKKGNGDRAATGPVSPRSSKSRKDLSSDSASSRERQGVLAAPDRAGKTSLQIFLPVLLFFVCFGLYVSNGDFLPGGDQQGNMLAVVNLLKRHTFSLGPPDSPASFIWVLRVPERNRNA